jgi:hypothetical protein
MRPVTIDVRIAVLRRGKLIFTASHAGLSDVVLLYCFGTQTAHAFEPFTSYKTDEAMQALLEEVEATEAFSKVGLSPGGQKQSHSSRPPWSRLKSGKTGKIQGFRVEIIRGAVRHTEDDMISQIDLLSCNH